MLMQDVISLVADEYGIGADDILGRSREGRFVRPRQVAMYLCYTELHRSTTEVGRDFGGRDHTTVMHARKKIEENLVRDPGLRDRIDRLRRTILEAMPDGGYSALLVLQESAIRNARAISRLLECKLTDMASRNPHEFLDMKPSDVVGKVAAELFGGVQ